MVSISQGASQRRLDGRGNGHPKCANRWMLLNRGPRCRHVRWREEQKSLAHAETLVYKANHPFFDLSPSEYASPSCRTYAPTVGRMRAPWFYLWERRLCVQHFHRRRGEDRKTIDAERARSEKILLLSFWCFSRGNGVFVAANQKRIIFEHTTLGRESPGKRGAM